MASHSIAEDVEAQDMIKEVKPNMTRIEKLNAFAKELIIRKGYIPLNSEYFTSLRHTKLYYRPIYFYPAPGEKICVIDILLPHGTLKDKSQLITQLELLNKECKEIRSILLQEYQNCPKVFNDQQFGYDEFGFIPKRSKLVPLYGESLQVVFSVKPIILTIKGKPEYDIQRDSRVDIVPIEKIQWYLNQWRNEVVELAKKAYNIKKFKHFEAQDTFEKWTLLFLMLYMIPVELNNFLQWNLWFLSFYFFLAVALSVGISNFPHNYLRYKKFSKLCREEIISSKWVDQSSFLKPFLTRSKQLLVQPLENKQGVNQKVYSQNRDEIKPLFSKSPTTNSMNTIGTTVKTSRPVESRGEIREDTNTKVVPEELVPDTPLIKPSGPRGIKTLLLRKSKSNVNIEIYKEQLGDLYSKLKTTTDFEVFRITALRIITLILTCEWFKRTGTPPVNIRIREVSNDRIDHFRQAENLLTQFLERLPDAINIDEVYRFATIINMGQMNQKMIDHVEWKIEDWLLDYKLLPANKMKVLQANHSKITSAPERIVRNYTDKVDSTLSKFKTIDLERKMSPKQEDKPEIPEKPKITNKPNTEKLPERRIERRPFTSPTRKEQSNIVEEEKSLDTIINEAKGHRPLLTIGEEVLDYYRFNYITKDVGYNSYGTPVCVLAYDSRIHTDKPLQEFKEIAKQMSNFASYVYFDYANVKQEISTNTEFEPLLEPRLWIRDKSLGIDKNFKFSPSAMANFLSGVRRKLRNKDAPDPSFDESVNGEVHEFEQVEEDDQLSPEDLEHINIDADLPESVKQAARVYETEEHTEPVDAVMQELEEFEKDARLDNSLIDQEIVVRHETPFLQKELFKTAKNKGNGIIIDSNNFLHSFLPEINIIKKDYGYIPDYYLMHVFDFLYRKLDEWGFGPIIFYTDPDFYIYLLPEPQKSRKIAHFKTKEKYLYYQASTEESNYFEHQRKLGLFRQVEKGGDTDMEILVEGSTHDYKILTNDQFNQSRYDQFWEYVASNRLTFKIDKSAMTIYDSKNNQMGEPLFLIKLPGDIKEKVSSIVKTKADIHPQIRRLTSENAKEITNGLAKGYRANILEKLSIHPMNTLELQKSINGKNEVISIAIKALADENKIVRIGSKWTINTSTSLPHHEISNFETSVIEIVFGAFHAKIGPIILFPTCSECLDKFNKDKNTIDSISEFDLRHHLKLTNCKCPLPKTGIPRDVVRTQHLNITLNSKGFQTSEGEHTFLSYRWSKKVTDSARQELSWAILIYVNPKNPVYNIERELIRDFLWSYDFNIDEGIRSLVEQGFKGAELDEKFYDLMYEYLMNFIDDLTKRIHHTLNELKE